MNCFLIAADRGAARVQALAKHAQGLGYTVSYVADVAALHRDRTFAKARTPLVLMPEEAGAAPGAVAEAAIQLARAEQGRAFVVHVAAALAPDLYKALVRSQSGEWIGWDNAAGELREVTRTLGATEPAESNARIVSFLPSKGGVGNTTLTVETGMRLSSRRKQPLRVALLDLNLQGGTLADALDIEPRFDIAEIAAQPERLDEQLVDVFTSRHTPRLDVFACPPRRIAFDDVPPAILFTFIDTIARRYEAILIDLPKAWVPWIDNILQGSDAVVLSGGATVPALRALTQSLAHLDTLEIPADRLAVAVNACDVDLLGRIAHRDQIERPLSGRSVFCLRRDGATANAALDAGRSLLEMAPNARLTRDLGRVAEWCGTAAKLA
ncbi:CpaE family protein [Methylobacterium sp. J-090]|uniref:AAA family ATPase n=1 Tax=Methylobacterium sp. J-090 TaxID=2836666 RepID=UPI001FBC1302|nr:AAA family ATPase [Methylobacterium sp. J-090]MCJ2082586.1 AAA family ATPase [Methylobacterium sp. J-090]